MNLWKITCISICIVFVLMGWSLLPNALRRFQIYCAAPNLGITRTWIRQLNFALMLIFSGLRFFNEPEISDLGLQLKVPPGGLVLGIFTTWKNLSTSAGLNLRTLDFEASMLPRDHRGRLPSSLPSPLWCAMWSYRCHLEVRDLIWDRDWSHNLQRNNRSKWSLVDNPNHWWRRRHIVAISFRP